MDAHQSRQIMSLTFVITGTLSKPRDEFKRLIESRGHKVSSSVTGKTDYLLAGYDAGSKLDKALDLGITVLNERELMDAIKLAGTKDTPPAPRTIYHFYTEEHGENQAMFDEDFNLIGAWHCNDADFRLEYMRDWLRALGIIVKSLPEDKQGAALNDLCDHMGYGGDFGD